MDTRITFAERCRIEDMARRNICNQHIAKDLGRHHSTVALEIERGGGAVNYTAKKGEEIAKERRKMIVENATREKDQLNLTRRNIEVVQELSYKDKLNLMVSRLLDIAESLNKIVDDLK